MALAGPVSNLLLVVVTGLALRISAANGVLHVLPSEDIDFGRIALATQKGSSWEMIAFVLGALFSMNLLLAVSQSVATAPLDGSGVVPLFLTESLTARYQDFHPWKPDDPDGRDGGGMADGEPLFWRVFPGAVTLLLPGRPYFLKDTHHEFMHLLQDRRA
jgi:hypothetical protein